MSGFIYRKLSIAAIILGFFLQQSEQNIQQSYFLYKQGTKQEYKRKRQGKGRGGIRIMPCIFWLSGFSIAYIVRSIFFDLFFAKSGDFRLADSTIAGKSRISGTDAH